MSISLVCAYTVARPHPQAHPVTLLRPALTAPQAVPKPFQAYSPLATPRGPAPPSLRPLTCTFSARNPSLPKIPTQAQTRVSRLRSDFISPQISSQPGCWAGPGFPSGTQGPSLLPDAWSLEMSCGCNLELVGRQGGLTAGRVGATGCGSGAKAAPSASQARLGRGQPWAQVWGDKLGSPAVGRGPQGPAQRRAGPRLSRSPPARAQGLRPACATPLHKSFSQQSTSTFKIPELMKPIR